MKYNMHIIQHNLHKNPHYKFDCTIPQIVKA
jgi:hypothetical protein